MDGYQNFKLHPEISKYLRFKVYDIVYECTSLPFGANFAPLYFTKILKPVVTFLRNPYLYDTSFLPMKFHSLISTGIRILPYLDDFLIFVN